MTWEWDLLKVGGRHREAHRWDHRRGGGDQWSSSGGASAKVCAAEPAGDTPVLPYHRVMDGSAEVGGYAAQAIGGPEAEDRPVPVPVRGADGIMRHIQEARTQL
ncbi:hypothetical protein GCM10022226_28100 [Sphaerisporangium flaviroseum]|uniref:Methylated-DNA-[protein]-cysteine S-methyltransferase DNA binding domain-containing protein n=1 Tax=Sphaerisporangium flaviroseum TaxID=509199 RepID=A0ABP7HX38_9ACTN